MKIKKSRMEINKKRKVSTPPRKSGPGKNKRKPAKSTVSSSKKILAKSLQPKRVSWQAPQNTKAAVKTVALRQKTKLKEPIQIAAVESAPATPDYLVTPSAPMLKSFRDEAKRRSELAKKLLKAKTPGTKFMAPQTKNGKPYIVDLRVHTPATNGYFSTAGVETGSALVRLAKVKGIDIIGVTDYYNASFVDAVQEHARGSDVIVLPGFDMCCRVGGCGDVHFVVLFPEGTNSDLIFSILNKIGVPKEAYGRNDYCLERPFAQVVDIVEGAGAIIIPSRIDKTPHSQSAIPLLIENYGFHAFDLVHPENTDYFSERWPAGGFTFFSFSNANALAQIGSRTARIRLSAPGFSGIYEMVSRRQGFRDSQGATVSQVISRKIEVTAKGTRNAAV